MSVDYGAKIMVGVYRADLIKNMSEEYGDPEDLIHDGDLDSCPLSYDSDRMIVGIEYLRSGDYSAREMSWNQNTIDKMKQEFREATGLEPKVWLCTHGH